MQVLHRNSERGKGDYGWLSTRYSFSFADWFEPSRMGLGTLRVLNDDMIAPQTGFPLHMHHDMEIITVVMKGTVTHTDSLGNTGRISEGEVQAMSAGSGVAHAEYNESANEPLELFQIWIEPKVTGIAPRYETKHVGFSKLSSGSVQLVGKDALHINQDAGISFAVVDHAAPLLYEIAPGNGLYVFMIDGEAVVSGTDLAARDALGIYDEQSVTIATASKGRMLLIEVPMK